MIDVEYLSLAEAARIAGYSSTSTLQAAARAKPQRLKTLRPEPPYLTTRAWLDEYLHGLKASMAHRRGQPRGENDESA